MQLYDDCPGGDRCGPWRTGIDVRLCVRCGQEFPDGQPRDAVLTADRDPSAPDRARTGEP